MLLSMTGFGEAHRQTDGVAVVVEVRTINNRYFKLTLKCGEGYSLLEPEIEGVVRQQIRRGTVQVSLRVDRVRGSEDYQLNQAVLSNYRRQIEQLSERWQLGELVPLAQLLMLPGVVIENPTSPAEAEEEWPLVREALVAAMENLAHMRKEEGRAMAADLRANCRTVAGELTQIEERAPLVVEAYRARLVERLQAMLAEFAVTLDPADLIKEVGLFAERSDISEEIVRLRSHLEQFDSIMELPESSGRKLEFLTQEMFRETNTIGSKANDVQIARHVIEIKASIERIREMIQNVE
ncbi:MAG TPA: YicC/YloC family endoribonuclease [Pirellulales bacterium]|nr:YicC/YloC family endoribonuclease [Pirellulales bacterium]